MSHVTVSRRSLVAGIAAASALSASPRPVRAAAPLGGGAAPAWYRFRIGSAEATVVSDGPLGLGAPAAAFSGVPAAEMERDLRDAFLPTGDVVLQQNVLVLNTGRQLLLFDTGTGASTMFGPGTGRLLGNLRAAGFEPGQIDAVLLTHAHADHCFGLVDAGGRPTFPNARVCITRADFDFWTDEAKLSNPGLKNFIAGARTNLLGVRDRLSFVADGQEAAPGVTVLATPGHTVGHVSYAVASGPELLIFTGDTWHHHVLPLKRPGIRFVYDTDAEEAVRSRVRLLDRLATDRTAFLTYHFPFPGVGHVEKVGEGYRWHPAPMTTLL